MKLSKHSKKILSLLKYQFKYSIPISGRAKECMREIYHDILDSYKNLEELKKRHQDVHIQKIMNIYEIPKPKFFNANSFPIEIRRYIDNTVVLQISFSLRLFERNVKVHFMTEETNVENNVKKYRKYMDLILMWMCILNKYAYKSCSKNIVIYLYFTPLEKRIPVTSIDILDEIHVNSAFTSTCPADSEIIIFRKEEWFKVFIHETFHSFGLDFSNMNNQKCNEKILQLFDVNSEVKLYESYTETWAEIINCAFCSFLLIENKSEEKFMRSFNILIELERKYSFMQMVKTLDFMGIEYKDLYLKESILRKTMYKEKTSVLAYYIIKCILMNNYSGFLSWCDKNNSSLLSFKQTPSNLLEYCKFVEANYKTPRMLNEVRETVILLRKLREYPKENKFLLTNMRMSACELE